MRIETERLIITEMTLDMVPEIQANSLDEDNRRFVPDEVFETIEDATEVVEYLMEQYETLEGPLVYAALNITDNHVVGYVQLVPLDDFYEVGYHIGKPYTKQGYATEAIQAFLPVVSKMVNINEVYGICLKENIASIKVMNKCGFEVVFEGLGEYQEEQREIYKALWKASK